MAPPKSKKPQNHPDGEQCDICQKVIARRGDMPRHKRLHAAPTDKDAMLHRCPWDGCSYSSLQKPNVDTHYRTHTKERNKACPECDSKFSDPGSLIRHRKNLHGYVPAPRKTRQRVSTAAVPEQTSSTRGSHRHQPYSRSPSESSSSLVSSSSELTPGTSPTTTATEVATTGAPTTNAFLVTLANNYTAMQSIFPPKPRTQEDLNVNFDTGSYPGFFYDPDPEGINRPSPKLLFPAAEAGKELQQPVINYEWVNSRHSVSLVEKEQSVSSEPGGPEWIQVQGREFEQEQPWNSLPDQHLPLNSDIGTCATTPSSVVDYPGLAYTNETNQPGYDLNSPPGSETPGFYPPSESTYISHLNSPLGSGTLGFSPPSESTCTSPPDSNDFLCQAIIDMASASYYTDPSYQFLNSYQWGGVQWPLDYIGDS